jgi:predicted Zn-dependent protease with MMP-like domain
MARGWPTPDTGHPLEKSDRMSRQSGIWCPDSGIPMSRRLIAMPINVGRERFEELVSEALDIIPEELAVHIENVAVVVQDWPTEGQQRKHRGMLLGLYEGIDLTRRSPMSYSGVMPDRITIFRKPHMRITDTEERLRKRIAVTVVHEIGHHFGISDQRLRDLGW